ncbi:class I SAM-dependent methyltransferase [Roseivirga sp.]|uniref:class I SAM-dependent methyltransferase n=1 Tax=Roseivirga sp. TaxID=1964215 RepID=UPI003B52C5B5
MKKAIDRFSKQSDTYRKFRPVYPQELYDFLFSRCETFDHAWDCGTGNGQVAAELAKKFKKVTATDISQKQLNHAEPCPNIQFKVSRAENTDFGNSCFDLITVGQAIHWFDIPAFFGEAERVLKPGGLLAFWGYGLLRVNALIDQLIDHFYTHAVGPLWDFERKHVDSNYESIAFPWQEIDTPKDIGITTTWTIDEFEGYFNSWSAVQNYKEAHNGENPVDQLMNEVGKVWRSGTQMVSFPIFIKAGLKSS